MSVSLPEYRFDRTTNEDSGEWEQAMSKAAAPSVIAIIGILFASSSPLDAAEVTFDASSNSVAKVALVTTRDGNGRAQRFMDTAHREFSVKYDGQKRVQSVEATKAPHICDIVWVGYDAGGDMAGLRFRTGYALFFGTRTNGIQLIRDSLGGALLRTEHGTERVAGAAADQSVKLAVVLSDLESLLSMLGESPR